MLPDFPDSVDVEVNKAVESKLRDLIGQLTGKDLSDYDFRTYLESEGMSSALNIALSEQRKLILFYG